MSPGATPLVSVVISTCERLVCLRQALASVVAPRHRNQDIVLEGLGGPSDPAAILGGFADLRSGGDRNARNLGSKA
jgi:hypothetical protein